MLWSNICIYSTTYSFQWFCKCQGRIPMRIRPDPDPPRHEPRIREIFTDPLTRSSVAVACGSWLCRPGPGNQLLSSAYGTWGAPPWTSCSDEVEPKQEIKTIRIALESNVVDPDPGLFSHVGSGSGITVPDPDLAFWQKICTKIFKYYSSPNVYNLILPII